MPQNDGEVRVEITGDSTKIKKELKETEAAVKNTTESISEMTDALEDTSGSNNSFNGIAESAENVEKAVAGATNEANNFGESIEDIGKEAEKSGEEVSEFSNKLETISKVAKISVAAIAAISAAMIKLTSDTAAYADNIDKASQKLGVSAEFYQEWEAVLQHSGTSMESMAFTFKTLANAAQDMSKDQQAAFEKLGISIENVASLSAEDLFAEVISRLQQMEEGTERTAIATDLLGRGAMEMGALLNTSAEDTQKMIDTVHELGGVMGNEAVKAGAAFQDNLQDLKTSLNGLKNDFVAEFLPSVNNTITTANEKLPKLESTVKNIGKSIGNVTEFALENHEAILSLITAYGTFYGVMKAGNAINTAVTAVKTLTTATQAATAAQEANNAAAAANPYVLLASAVAAVTVGLIAYANSVDSVHNRIKDVNKEVKELKENTEESIASTEAEIAVFKDKARQYEELREKASRTAGEEERLKELAEELQQYMPEGTQLIDEQTGAYNSLADSIDGVVEAMRRRATIAAYEEEYTELIKQQIEAQKNLDEATERFKNFSESGGKISANPIQNMAFTSLKKDLDDAAKTLSEIEERKKDLEIGMETLSKQEPKQQISTGETYADYMQREGEKQLAEDQQRRADDLVDYENNLKAKVDELDKSLALRKISEEEYYEQLGNYITKNRNLESDEYYKQLDRYNKYLDKKADAADKAAEQQLKAEKSAAEKRQKEAEAAEKKAQQEAETAAKKAQQEAETAAKKAQQETEKLLSEQEKTVEKSLSNIIKQFQKAYDEVDKKRENYRKKLLSIGGDIFSVNEIKNPDGTTTKQYTINNIDEQIKKMRQYNADVAKLKKQGVSSALLEELTSLSDSDSQQFASFLSGLTDEELAKINEAYEEKRRVADELSKEMYADEYAAIADGINTALDEVSAGAADKGKEAAEIYAKAFGDTLLKHSEDFYPLLGDEKYIKWFGNSGDIFGGDMGKIMKLFTGSNFADIATKVTSTVRSEQARYSAPAYTAAAASSASDTTSADDSKRKSDIAAILEKLNKPLPIMLDGKVIAEAVMTYQNNYMKGTGG